MILRLLLLVCLLISAAPAIAAEQTESTYDRVMRTGTIRCGYTPIEPGIIVDPNSGKISGIVHDLVEEMAKNLSLKVEWAEEIGVGEIVTALESNRVDMMCTGIWLSSARARYIDATNPLFFFPATVWVKADKKLPANLPEGFNDENTIFSAIEGSSSMHMTKRFFPKAKIYALPEMSNIAEMMLAITAGKADATILTNYNGYSFLEKNPGTIKNALPVPYRNDPAVMLFRRNQMEFKSMINTAIDELFYSGYTQKMIDKYNIHADGVYPRAKAFEHNKPKD